MERVINFIKNHKLAIIFCVIVGILFSYPLFNQGLYYGHDTFFHLGRLDGIVTSWQDGQLIPRIYPYKNMGFGYASPLFYNDIFLYPFALLYYLGLPLIASYKLLLIVVAIITAFTMYYSVRKFYSKNKCSAYISTFLYMFSSYHALDVYSRSALGEIIALAIIPLALLIIYQVIIEGKHYWFRFGIIMSLLLFAHNISFFLVCLLFGFIIIFNFKRVFSEKRILLCVLKATLFALCISAFFLLPMLEQMVGRDLYVNHIKDEFHMNSYRQTFSQSFVMFPMLGNSNGSSTLNTKMSLNIGVLLFFIPAAIFLIRKKIDDKKMYGYLKLISIVGYALIIMTTNLFDWRIISIFSFIQFPWRLYILITPIMGFVSGIIMTNYFEKGLHKIVLSILFIISFSLFSISINEVVESDNYLDDNLTIADIQGDKIRDPFLHGAKHNRNDLSGAEYLPYTPDMNYREAGSCINYANMEPAYCDYIRAGSKIEFIVDEPYYNVELLMPITYYKGYDLYLIDSDGNKIREVDIYPQEYYQVVAFNINGVNGRYVLEYNGTLIQKVSLGISTISFVVAIICVIKRKKNKPLNVMN